MEITDALVEQALQAEHDQVGRNYVDTPFWYTDLDPSERVRAHDGMRAALEAVAVYITQRLTDLTDALSKIHKDSVDGICFEDVEDWPCRTIQAVQEAWTP